MSVLVVLSGIVQVQVVIIPVSVVNVKVPVDLWITVLVLPVVNVTEIVVVDDLQV